MINWRSTRKNDTPLQSVIREFDGKNYLKLTKEEIMIVDTMRRLWYLQIDDQGEITATKTGQGIVDGRIKTSREVPSYLEGYMSKGVAKCGTAGSQS